MMIWNMLAVVYSTFLGPVQDKDISGSFWLMLMGMGGIFVVMLVLFLVIVILNNVTKNKDNK